MSFTLYTEKEMDKFRIIQKFADKVIDIDDVCGALGCSQRTAYRYLKALKERGVGALRHGLRGRCSNNRSDKLEKLKKYALQQRYSDFGPTLLASTLLEELGWPEKSINAETLRLKMIQRGTHVVKKRRTRTKREKRVRREKTGMLIQFDGSYHDRLENGEEMCLLLAIDDATSEIKTAFFAESESIESMMSFWSIYFETWGKPEAIYVDRHSTYKVNHVRDQFDTPTLTRFQRGMQKLGIQVIFATSPEGKGRVERSFRTLQDRLIKKMRLSCIETQKQANKYLKDIYIPDHNKQFAVSPAQSGDLHTPLNTNEYINFPRYFAKETIRTLKRDGTVQYDKHYYQIEKGQPLANNNKVVVKETLCNKVAIFSGHIQLVIKSVSPIL